MSDDWMAARDAAEVLDKRGVDAGSELARIVRETRHGEGWRLVNPPLRTNPSGEWQRSPVIDTEDGKIVVSFRNDRRRLPFERAPFVFQVRRSAIARSHAGGGRGGRPPAADWDAIAELYRIEVGNRGKPGPEGVENWRTQADVVRWLDEVLVDRGESASPTTLKDHAGQLMAS